MTFGFGFKTKHHRMFGLRHVGDKNKNSQHNEAGSTRNNYAMVTMVKCQELKNSFQQMLFLLHVSCLLIMIASASVGQVVY